LTRLLVIKLGALGDVAQAFDGFAAIRAARPDSHISLLTTAPYAKFLAGSPWFDAILADARPAPWNVPGLVRLRRQLAGFDFVIDLQTSARSSRYFLLAGRPRWSGIARGCSHRHANPGRDAMHTRERQREQLAIAGIDGFPAPDLRWLAATPLPQALAAPYALLIPGAAPHRPEKRWPAARFGDLARLLASRNLTPVIVGAPAESALSATIVAACPSAIDLVGCTDLRQLASVAARAACAIGNDTGPMHLAAALGVPAIVLFSSASDPALTAPRYPDGRWATILREPDLADLPLDRVAAALPERQ
jgi:ADP-heptose:LPS heptosyltransferase